jgi:hypothetical protein
VYSYKHDFNEKVSYSFLWKAYYKTNYTNKDFETRLIYKLYANVKKDSNTEKAIFPFYSIQKLKNGSYNKGYFFNIYQKSKTFVPNTNNYYLEEKVFWYIRLRSNFKYLKEKRIIKTRKFK